MVHTFKAKVLSKGGVNMTDIVVEVRKGTITGLYCDAKDIRFVVVDWDLLERNSPDAVGLQQDHEPLGSLPRDTRIEFNRVIAA